MTSTASSSSGPRHGIVLVSGNDLIAAGAIAAGCDFFSGYPITPASEIYAAMMRRLPARGGRAIGAPDEISALSYAVGASLAGCPRHDRDVRPGLGPDDRDRPVRAHDGDAGRDRRLAAPGPVHRRRDPGRAGRRAARGARHLGRLSHPRPVPRRRRSTPTRSRPRPSSGRRRCGRPSCSSPTRRSARRSRASTSPISRRSSRRPRRGARRPTPRTCPTASSTVDDVPRFTPVGGRLPVTTTGSAHNEHGRLRKNDPGALRQLEHLQAKVSSRAAELERVRHDRREGADTLLVSYGVSARSCRQAAAIARGRGRARGHPRDPVALPGARAALSARPRRSVRRVVVVEENGPGLYARELRPHLPRRRGAGPGERRGRDDPVRRPCERRCRRDRRTSTARRRSPTAPAAGIPHVLHALDRGPRSRSACRPHRYALVTDIGCVGLADAYFPSLHTVHALHGRAAAVAAGIQLGDATGRRRARSSRSCSSATAASTIGLLHLVHAAQLDVDVTVLVHNNLIYGMTGGQHSGFTPEGLKTTTTPGRAAPSRRSTWAACWPAPAARFFARVPGAGDRPRRRRSPRRSATPASRAWRRSSSARPSPRASAG